MREKVYSQTQEDIFRERAQVLARTGESVHLALEILRTIERGIDYRMGLLKTVCDRERHPDVMEGSLRPSQNREKLLNEINSEILKYNKAREHAKLRYYYLIVTREAMGLRRHKTVEDIYTIPPKREYLRKRS